MLSRWRFFFQHGADSSKKNRDGATPLDLVREGDQDVADLLRGNAALLDAAKKGNLARVQRLVSSDNINCRDAQGRNSTPLHLAGKWRLALPCEIVSSLVYWNLKMYSVIQVSGVFLVESLRLISLYFYLL